LIDDEALLLKVIAEALSDDSDVVTALGGDAALALLAADRAFDLVICDLQMPKTDGAAIHAALETLAPELLPRLVIMSGGAVTARARQFIDRVRPRVLAKPLAIDEATALIRRAAKRRG
jgi:DNA-binding NtrC family response regulator